MLGKWLVSKMNIGKMSNNALPVNEGFMLLILFDLEHVWYVLFEKQLGPAIGSSGSG